MREAWQNSAGRERIWQLVMDIQEHADLLLDVPLPIHQREHLLHIRHVAQTILVMTGAAATDADREDSLSSPVVAAEGNAGGPVWLPRRVVECRAGHADRGDLDGVVLPSVSGNGVSGVGSLCILLVEDNPFTQKLMTRMLNLRGHTVTVANHGEEALAILTGSGRSLDVVAEPLADEPLALFDLVLMDVRMPVLDGLRTTVAIRQWERQLEQQRRAAGWPLHRLHLPIIAVTALIGEADRERAFQSGMDAFHGKPIQANQIFAEIERLVPPCVASLTTVHTGQTDTIPDAEEEHINTKLDISVLLRTVENDRVLLQEVIDLYRADAPGQLRCIRDGIAANNASMVQEAAHALKGASGAFGRTQAYDLAFKLEQMGRTRDLSQAVTVWEQLQQAVHTLGEALLAELTQNGISA